MGKKIKGTISINSLGQGYVKTEELEEDVKIESSLLNTALHNDEVEVFLLPRKKGKATHFLFPMTEECTLTSFFPRPM